MKLRKIFCIAIIALSSLPTIAQINTDQVLRIGRNALYFEDYVLSIQYFNQVIAAKPYLAQPYFFRALAKFNLDDFAGAEADVSTAIEHNPFITDAYELRGVTRQNMGKIKEAVEDYDKALSILPENRGILFNKALALEELKDYDRAEEAFNNLIKHHPRFDSGYLGRAKLYLSIKDTAKAISDIDKALEINKNAVNGYVMRADIAINSHGDYQKALEDMNEAIKLQPRYAGYFINRAFLRHQTDDYYGAMSDYDYAVQLDPLNSVALYNRALLRAEVHDYNRAIDDLNQVIALHPNDYRTLYNRSIVFKEKGDYKDALKDVNKVIEAYPDLAAAYFLRFDIKRLMGDRSAEKDYNHSLALAKQRVKKKTDSTSGNDTQIGSMADVFGPGIGNPSGDDSEPQEVVAARFSSLLTINDNSSVEHEYNNKSIRGKVQNQNMSIDIEPMFVLSYYSAPTELKPTSDYMREVYDLNRTNSLRFILQVTNKEPSLSQEDEIQRHFESIEYYNSYIATHATRVVDFFGRGMDHITVHNYKAAEEDFSRAIDIMPTFTLAWFMRSVARYKDFLSESENNNGNPADAQLKLQKARITYNSILSDIDQVLKLSPNSAIAYFNKGVIYVQLQDFTSALSAFNKAIELKPDFGEAYYNRGYVYFKLGNRDNGTADLSKAGELGIVPSYNLMKRMNN
ncbi:putative uncharacterized protein [Bacteroides sp. CAG:927]|nr:putative uncharacterized protein [Bacteroides sp. CAG:927]